MTALLQDHTHTVDTDDDPQEGASGGKGSGEGGVLIMATVEQATTRNMARRQLRPKLMHMHRTIDNAALEGSLSQELAANLHVFLARFDLV